MRLRLQMAIRYLELRQKTLMEVTKQEHFDNDYLKGYNDGIKFAAKSLGEEIQNIRQLIDGFMIEDVDLSGMESEEHVS
jgi:hypothetical protein